MYIKAKYISIFYMFVSSDCYLPEAMQDTNSTAEQ